MKKEISSFARLTKNNDFLFCFIAYIFTMCICFVWLSTVDLCPETLCQKRGMTQCQDIYNPPPWKTDLTFGQCRGMKHRLSYTMYTYMKENIDFTTLSHAQYICLFYVYTCIYCVFSDSNIYNILCTYAPRLLIDRYLSIIPSTGGGGGRKVREGQRPLGELANNFLASPIQNVDCMLPLPPTPLYPLGGGGCIQL